MASALAGCIVISASVRKSNCELKITLCNCSLTRPGVSSCHELSVLCDHPKFLTSSLHHDAVIVFDIGVSLLLRTSWLTFAFFPPWRREGAFKVGRWQYWQRCVAL